jgi:hypothetical protein
LPVYFPLQYQIGWQWHPWSESFHHRLCKLLYYAQLCQKHIQIKCLHFTLKFLSVILNIEYENSKSWWWWLIYMILISDSIYFVLRSQIHVFIYLHVNMFGSLFYLSTCSQVRLAVPYYPHTSMLNWTSVLMVDFLICLVMQQAITSEKLELRIWVFKIELYKVNEWIKWFCERYTDCDS